MWYDVSWPLKSPELWESAKRNAMVRELQPDIIINNRSQLPEDFGTPEEHVTAEGKGNTYYFWCDRWPGKEIAIGGLLTKLNKASFLVTGEPIALEQTENRLVLKGLPESSPDRIASVTIIKMEFESAARQVLGAGYVVL